MLREIEQGLIAGNRVADGATQIDQIPRGAVVFISSPPKTINAVYGGLMSTRAKYSGAAGTVVDGRIRDLQEHRDLEYPVSPFKSQSPLCITLSKVVASKIFQHKPLLNLWGTGLRARRRHNGAARSGQSQRDQHARPPAD